jgi:methylmalonyl-CoA/ethylmalonyl-CoA epimerase
MTLDHIGIVVRSVSTAARDWERLFGYKPLTEVVENGRQKVKVVFLGKPGSLDIKLVEPMDASSPAAAAAARGGGLHHLCFRCENLTAELSRLTGEGARVIAPPQPGEAFENRDIAFVYGGHGLSIELIDTSCRARRLDSDD